MNLPTHKDALEKWLCPGFFLYWKGQRFRLLAGEVLSPLLLRVEDLSTLEQATFRVETLFLLDDDASGPIFAPTLEALQAEIERKSPLPTLLHPEGVPEHLQQRADHILAVVETVDKFIADEERRSTLGQEPFRRTPAVRRACAQLPDPIEPATYYKYKQIYRMYGGDRSQVAAALRRTTFNQTKMDKTQLLFVDTHVLRFYARGRFMRPHPATLYRILQSTYQRTHGQWIAPEKLEKQTPENLVEELLDPRIPIQIILDNPEKAKLLQSIDLPSRSWFYQYLRWFESQPDQGKTIIVARHGKELWEREHLVFDTFVSRATLPLQYVFADHWLLDCFIVDDVHRSQVDRLWLTILIDAFSRSILGLALLSENPCIESIQHGLRHAIWPKTSHRELGIQEEWACYGIPQQLFLDNAWSHHAYSLENLARLIGQGGRFNSIDLVFRPPYKGRYGALIERFFGNLSSRMKELLPGAIRSNEPGTVYRAAQDACLLYQDVYRILHQWIVAYQHTPHAELAGLTPHQKWLEGIQFGYPMVPPLTPTLDRIFWRMSPETRVITSKGVCLFGLHYWSPELNGAQRVGLDGRPLPYHFSYDPADISRIALFSHEQWAGDVYAKELRQSDGLTRGLSLWEHNMAKALAHAQGKNPRDWLSTIGEIDALTQSRLSEKKKARRAAKRQISTHPATRSGSNDPLRERSDYTELLASFVDPEVNRDDQRPLIH